MTMPSRTELFQLPVAERMQLVEDLWDSIADSSEDLPLTDAQKEELDRRLEGWRENPAEGSSWALVRARVQDRGIPLSVQ